MMNDVLLSIYVPTFNHEKYITRALDSILMQKTRYSYEVLVGEDCSTDNTRSVLQEWERLHPDVFTIFYREQNMYKMPCNNGLDLKLRCKGKYIVCLEGDDFWTDPLKIEKQVSFLESHPDYYAVAHNCVVVGEDSLPNGETYPECKDEEYTLGHFASNLMPGQLTTVLSRNYMTDEGFDRSLVMAKSGPGDRNIYFSMAAQSRIFCMQEPMSAYRHITAGGSSYSATAVYKYEENRKVLLNRLEFAKKVNNPEAVRVAGFLYLMDVRYALLKGNISLVKAWKDAKEVGGWIRYLPTFLKRDVRRYITRKTPHI